MLKVTVRTQSAAFEDDPRAEAARILRAIADKIERGEDASHFLTVLDVNGNDVGRWKLSTHCPNCGRPLADPDAPGEPCTVCGAEGG